MGFFDRIFDNGFMPHGHCYFWQPDVLWSNVIGDGFIAAAYFSIPVLLLAFLKRRPDIQYRVVFAAFAVFILCCGTTHLLTIISVWKPVYYLEGVMKLCTAGVSMGTVILLVNKFPRIVKLPTSEQLRLANEKLTKEIKNHLQTVELLKQREESLAFIMRQAPVGMATFALDGRWTQANVAWTEMIGYTESELLDMNFQDITHPEDLPIDLNYVERFMQGSLEEASWEKRYLHKDGTPIWVLLSVSLIRDRLGDPSYFIAQAINIETRKQNEAALVKSGNLLKRTVEKRTHELQETNRDLENFIYAVTHDLRLPLKNTEGLIAALREEISESEIGKHLAIAEMIDMIEQNTLRMDNLITDLLSFSRAGRMDLQRQALDMEQIIRGLLDTLQPVYGNQNIELDLSPLPTAYGDKGTITQVWENLLSNAIKYARFSDPIRITIRGRREHGETIFSIQDNGVGFDPAYQDKLFKLFQRLHTDDVFDGTGVGLAFVSRVLQKHGGAITAESRPGEGATFTFRLPERMEDVEGEI